MTNFDYLTKDKATLAHTIDSHMTKPAKCAFCTRRDAPSCPVGIRCFNYIIQWLVRPHEEKQQ